MDEVRGEIFQGAMPNWEPLRAVAFEIVDDWMWMYEIETDCGLRIQAYKHWWTRRYMHIDLAGRVFAYTDDESYVRVELADVLEEALRPWWEKLRATPDQVAACWAVIDRARGLA